MPRSATFTVTPASPHSSVHNSRNEKPNYLISQLKIKDRVVDNFYDLRYSDSEFLVLAKAKYKEVTRQKMQQKQIIALIKETVLTLEAHHTEYDVQKVFDILNKKYGGHYITELTIHRDEGHFEDENGITYYPTKDIIKKEDGWYIVPLSESMNHSPEYRPKAEEFREKIDIDKFKPIHNIHAHVKFSMYDLTIGKTGRMKHKDLNDRIRTAALVLDLEYNPEKKNAKRVTVADKKAQHKAVRNEKVRNLFENGHVIEEANKRIIERERIVAEQQQELLGRIIEIKELELEGMSKNAKIVMLETKNREFEQLRYNSLETQKHISALETLNEEQKKDLLSLNTEVNKIKIDDDVKRERLDQLRHKINSIAHLFKIYPIDKTYEVNDKLVDAILSRTKTGIEARNELQTAKETISTQLVEIERLNALVDSRESELGEIDGLINGLKKENLKLINQIKSTKNYILEINNFIMQIAHEFNISVTNGIFNNISILPKLLDTVKTQKNKASEEYANLEKEVRLLHEVKDISINIKSLIDEIVSVLDIQIDNDDLNVSSISAKIIDAVKAQKRQASVQNQNIEDYSFSDIKRILIELDVDPREEKDLNKLEAELKKISKLKLLEDTTLLFNKNDELDDGEKVKPNR